MSDYSHPSIPDAASALPEAPGLAAPRRQLNRGGAERHPLKDRKDDLYETPAEATQTLLRHEATLGQTIWEPACGPGAIVSVMRAHGKRVIATDLVDYGCPDSESGIDFLMEHKAPPGISAIVTNPPFKLADQFIRHALTLCPTVVMLLRLAYLEGAGRKDLHVKHLERVWLGVERLNLHRHNWHGPKNESGAIAFAWFVFRRDKGNAPATIRHVSWRAA